MNYQSIDFLDVAFENVPIYLFIYWSFTPLLTLFQLYHGDSSLIHDPWVNTPVLGYKICLAQGHSTMTEVPRLGIEPGTPGFENVP